jgi:hypothetical protein
MFDYKPRLADFNVQLMQMEQDENDPFEEFEGYYEDEKIDYSNDRVFTRDMKKYQ